ncbi:MAG: hypothetical protein ACIAXF_10300 [Phycisphaerales bacterium JB063]
MKPTIRQAAKKLASAVGLRPMSAKQREQYADARAFAQRVRPIVHATPKPPRDAGTAVIIALHAHLPTAKTEAALCKALQAQGMRIRLLVPPEDTPARIVYDAYGLNDTIDWTGYLDPAQRATHAKQVDAFLATRPTFEQMLGYDYRGSVLGEHALSLVVRQAHAGKIDLASGETRERFREALVDGMLATDAAHKLYDDTDPALVLFCERGYTPFGDLFDAALSRSLNTVQWLGSHIDHALHFKRYTWDTRTAHPISLATPTWERVCAMDLPDDGAFLDDFRTKYETGDYNRRHNLQSGKRIVERDALVEQLGLDPNKKTAVIFSHILWDATFFYGKGLFPDYAQWLVESVRVACANDKVNWLVKLHPVNVWRLALDGYEGELAEHVLLRDALGELPGHVQMIEPDAPVNTASLWGVADYALTVRGTVGMEMPMFGTTVLTAGTGRYAGLGFTVDSETKEQYLERLAAIQDVPAMTEHQVALARRHAQGVFGLRPLPFTSFTLSYPHGEVPTHLHPQLEVNAPDVEAFVAGADMQRFGRWAAMGEGPDLLGGLEA